jgi:FkbM family methyltransferase
LRERHLFDIFELIPRPQAPLKLVDVGALSMGDRELFQPLLDATSLQIVGFEPHPGECEKLNLRHGPPNTFLPCVIGDGSVRTFYNCNMPWTSSLYPPNSPLLAMFQNLEELTRVVSTSQVQTVRLDDIPQADDADYLKLDVQGAELDVIRGADQLLKKVVFIQTEVEFIPMYLGQPLFAEVDQALRSAGFLLHRFAEFAGRAFRPMVLGNDVNSMGSQLIWAEAFYVRSFMQLHELSPQKLLKLAAILHIVSRSYDMVPLVLRHYDARAGTQLSLDYVRRIIGERSADQTASAPASVHL